MKILHFIPVYIPAWNYGGPILSVSRLCESLTEQNIDVRVITTNLGLSHLPSYQKECQMIVNGVPVYYYPAEIRFGLVLSSSLLRDLDSHLLWADLVHVSAIWQPLGIPIQNRAHVFGVPVIQSLRGALSPYSWSRSFIKKLLYYHIFEKPILQRASAIHCTSQTEVQEVEPLRLRPPIHLLPNPIDQSSLRYEPHLTKNWRKTHGLPNDQPLFLVAGRLHHKKGMDLLPKILYELRHKNWNIVFIGEDEDGTARRLIRMMSLYELSSRCHWISTMPAHKLNHAYNSADWLLLPSRHENFANVVIEALACGCGALVSTNVGVASELADCPGFASAPREHNAFKTLLASALETNRPGIHSANWISDAYSTSSIAHKAISIYQNVLAK